MKGAALCSGAFKTKILKRETLMVQTFFLIYQFSAILLKNKAKELCGNLIIWNLVFCKNILREKILVYSKYIREKKEKKRKNQFFWLTRTHTN